MVVSGAFKKLDVSTICRQYGVKCCHETTFLNINGEDGIPERESPGVIPHLSDVR